MNATASFIPRAALAAALAGACATTGDEPAELARARNDYHMAANGPAAQLDPSSLYTARKHLDRAELAFAQTPDDPWVRDQAYVADRKALLADARARTMLAQREQAMARAQLDALVANAAVAQREDRAAKQRTEAALDRARERASEEASDGRARAQASALQSLGHAAQVAEDHRGVVITISGQVLFAAGTATLMPAARDALDQVAEALRADPPRAIAVEGHTDALGSADFNLELSQRRAEAVRAYLISVGVAAELVSAHGHGEEAPVASNEIDEGRAHNRRVEIILSPAQK